MAKDPERRPVDGAALVAELRAVAGGAYGPGWEERGWSHLAAAALLLAALWPSGGPAAVQGTAVHRIRLRRHLLHGHGAAVKAAVTAGIVTAVAGAAAAAVIVARPTGHATPAPAATPTSTPARATTPAPAPAPAQLTGTQLAAALLPISDFPAGYSAAPLESSNSGSSLNTRQFGIAPTKASCRLGEASSIVFQDGSFYPGFGTAEATESFDRFITSGGTLYYFWLNEAVYQFSSPAKAEVFFSSVRTCLIDNKTWSNGVDTAPVNGDQAITADLIPAIGIPGDDWVTEPLFVLHGTDVFALSAASLPSPGPLTIPGAAGLIAELIARVDALSPAPSAGSSPVPAAVASPAPTSSAALRPTQVNLQGVTIGISAVNSDPAAMDVAATLAAYFGGIDARNYQQAWDTYTPALQAAVSFQTFSSALSTSQDTQIVVQSIQHDPDGDLDVQVGFQSHQAGQYGPSPGQTCTNWSLDYQLVASAGAQPSPAASPSYLINKVTDAGAGHTSC
jgi:hypothetical protein